MTGDGSAHEPSHDREPSRDQEPSRDRGLSLERAPAPQPGAEVRLSRAPRRSPRGDDGTPVLPDRAGEDRPEAWGERPDPEDDDERYLRERPPHW